MILKNILIYHLKPPFDSALKIYKFMSPFEPQSVKINNRKLQIYHWS